MYMYELGNINVISWSCWYITIKSLKMHNGKIKVVSVVIKSGRPWIINVKFEFMLRSETMHDF
jgi:hypothetical protein